MTSLPCRLFGVVAVLLILQSLMILYLLSHHGLPARIHLMTYFAERVNSSRPETEPDQDVIRSRVDDFIVNTRLSLQHSPHVHDEIEPFVNPPNLTTVAMGLSLTSRVPSNETAVTLDNMDTSMVFFPLLLTSFCKTCSEGFAYHFFAAFDFDDALLNDRTFLESFTKKFYNFSDKHCPSSSRYQLHFVQCNHSGNPAWAQNDAMMEAYWMNMDYFYLVNDDGVMETPNWTEAFIGALTQMDPPNVGVVGPNHHGGKTTILTFIFVSYRHFEVFGFFFPRHYAAFYVDDWITLIYQPQRSKKLQEVRLNHTKALGIRYNYKNRLKSEHEQRKQLEQSLPTLQTYIESVRRPVSASSHKVVSMSLSGVDPGRTYGAVRNAQLIRTHLPEWTLRVYLPTNTSSSPPASVINKLTSLGAQLVTRPYHALLAPTLWPYDVIDDPSVDYFLIREPTMRISQREARAVSTWFTRADVTSVQCARDLPEHAHLPIVDAFWGSSTKYLRAQLNVTYDSILEFYKNKKDVVGIQSFLSEVLWPRMGKRALCVDSVSRGRWKGSWSLERDDECMGCHYNQYEERRV